jgi:hypothetical protein
MHGAPLTPAEAVASVAWQVSSLEAQGLDRDRAIRRVASDHGMLPEKVRWCVTCGPARPGKSGMTHSPNDRARSTRSRSPWSSRFAQGPGLSPPRAGYAGA